MPPGVPVGTLAIGNAGAINAALLAASVLALGDPALERRLDSLAGSAKPPRSRKSHKDDAFKETRKGFGA